MRIDRIKQTELFYANSYIDLAIINIDVIVSIDNLIDMFTLNVSCESLR